MELLPADLLSSRRILDLCVSRTQCAGAHVSFPSPLGCLQFRYPLARNQYINTSPGVFSCIRAGASEYRRGMYSHRVNSPKNLAKSSGNTSSKIFSCIRAVANTGPACIRATINSPRVFPACIGFVPGGTSREGCDYRILGLKTVYLH